MNTLLKVKFTEIAFSGKVIPTLRFILLIAVLLSAFLFPGNALAGPMPGGSGS